MLSGIFAFLFVQSTIAGTDTPRRGITSEYKIDSWGIDNGLPQNSVNAILQTRDGFIWLGTFGGLVRFDGVNFTVYNRGNTPSMLSDRVLTLMEDKSGMMWVGTEGGGVMKFANGKFTSYTTSDGLANTTVHAMLQDSAGSIWMSHYEGHVTRFVNGKFTPYKTGFQQGGYIMLDSRGEMFYHFNDSALRFQNEQFVSSIPDSVFFGLRTISPLWDKQGRLWICKNGDILLCYVGGKLEKKISIRENLRVVGERNMKIDNDGNIWMLSTSGVIQYNGISLRLYSMNDGLSAQQVVSMMVDKEGNIWFGTLTAGVNRFRKKLITVVSSNETGAINNATSISQLHDGTIIAGFNCGKYKLLKNNSVVNSVAYPDSLNSCIWSVLEDSRKRLWLGTWGSGLFQSRVESDGTITSASKFTKIPSRNVLASYEDNEGRLLFGTTDDGLFTVAGDSVFQFSTTNGLSNNDVRAILQDSRGELWVGTMNGLNKLSDDGIQIYRMNDGLRSNSIRALYEDEEHILWIGTYGGGLSRIENGNIVSFTTDEGLFDNLVSHIIEDDDGNFWMGCNRGVFRVAKQELNEVAHGKRTTVNSVSFGKDYGLVNVETNGGFQPNALKSKDGRIYFPTVEGVAWLDPKDVRLNTTIIPVHINYVEVDLQHLEFSSTIHIGPDQNNLVIGYTAPSFIESKKVRFRYMLHGYDQTWIDAGTRREAYYTKLPQGTYKFTVIAANSDGVWNETGASFTLVVVPPFWMTWWFRGIGIMLFLSIGPILYVRRVRKLQYEKNIREQFSRNLLANVEQERKRIATELHDSIGQHLLVIKNRSSFGLRLLPDEQRVKEQLDGISLGASDSLKELRHIAYNLRPFELDRLGLTSALHGMIDKIRESSQVHIEANIADVKGVFLKENEINVFRIVQECLNNIIKHSEATKATVTIERNLQTISILISDNGKGFDIRKLSSVHKKQGLGVSGIEERVRILGGEMQLFSEPAMGTSIKVNIPVEQHNK